MDINRLLLSKGTNRHECSNIGHILSIMEVCSYPTVMVFLLLTYVPSVFVTSGKMSPRNPFSEWKKPQTQTTEENI